MTFDILSLMYLFFGLAVCIYGDLSNGRRLFWVMMFITGVCIVFSYYTGHLSAKDAEYTINTQVMIDKGHDWMDGYKACQQKGSKE